MTHERDPLGRLELETAADQAGLAADVVEVVADAEVRIAEAKDLRTSATSDVERVAAEIASHNANLDAIRAKAASSRADFELGIISGQDRP